MSLRPREQRRHRLTVPSFQDVLPDLLFVEERDIGGVPHPRNMAQDLFTGDRPAQSFDDAFDRLFGYPAVELVDLAPGQVAPQHLRCALVQLLKHRRFPLRPDTGIERGQVGIRQHVEVVELFRALEPRGELSQCIRIVDVPAERRLLHHEMMPDEKPDVGNRIGHSQAVQYRGGHADAGDFVVRHPARLRDVVQENGRVEEILSGQVPEHLMKDPLLLPQAFRAGDRDQRVLIRRIVMVDIVLEKSDELPELGDVAPENVRIVHLVQRFRHPVGPEYAAEE